MINHVLIIFLILHFFTDYYLQTDKLALDKYYQVKKFIFHVCIYFFIMLIPFIYYGFNLWYLLIGVIAGISHFLIDGVKLFIIKKKPYLFENICLYLIDQYLHIGFIVLGVLLLSSNQTKLLFDVTYNFTEANIIYLRWVLLFVLIFKPANVSFRIAFKKYKPQEVQDNKEDTQEKSNKAGAVIGNCERLLYCICFSLGQYTLLGLIITCKGFARHRDIQEKAGFAEYFLIGTFYSIVYSITSFWLVFHIIS